MKGILLMDSLARRPRQWGSFLDMLADISRQASRILRLKGVPANVVFLLPYTSTQTGMIRVWRFSGNVASARRRGVAIPVADLEPGGAA